MKVSGSKIRSAMLYIMVYYVLNKGLWDWLFGGFTKLFYYGLVAVGFLACAVYLLPKRPYRRLLFAFAFYCLVVFLNGLLLSNSAQFKRGIIEYLTFPLSFFALLYAMKGRTDFRKLWISLTYWGGLTSLLAFYEYLARRAVLPISPESVYLFQNGETSYRAIVFIGSPMVLGVMLGAMMILSMYFFHKEKRIRFLLLAGLDIAGILATCSRAPLILAFAGLIMMYCLFYWQKTLSRIVMAAMIAILLLGLVLLALFIIFPDFKVGIPSVDFLIYRFTSSLDFKNEWGNVERLKRWGYYIGQFLKKPLTGYGISTTNAYVVGNELVTDHGITTESGVLARFVETGLIGVFAYYGFLVLTLRTGFRSFTQRIRFSRPDRDLVFAVAVLTLIFLEDIILQISLDIFCVFVLCLMAAYAVNLRMNYVNRQLSGGTEHNVLQSKQRGIPKAHRLPGISAEEV